MSSDNLGSDDSNISSNQEGFISPLPSDTSITKASIAQPDTPIDSPAEVTPNDSQSIIKKYVKHVIELVSVLGFLFILLTAYFLFFDKVPYTEEEILAISRERIIPSIVQLRCLNKEGKEASIGTGSYYLDVYGNPLVDTNAHVVLDAYDGKYYGCNIYFPRSSNGSFYDSAYEAGKVSLYHDVKSKINEYTEIPGIDFATLEVAKPLTSQQGIEYPFPPVQESFLNAIDDMCKTSKKPINIGDKIYIIGYPDTGGDSITLTDGVVSGFDGEYNEFIKISASTAHGNSGGIAIGAKNGCYYGIPTRATFQEGGNLGLLISGDFIADFVSGVTKESTYNPDLSGQYFTTYTDREFNIKIDYPGDWEISEELVDGSKIVWFYSPPENALDKYVEEVSLVVGNKVVNPILYRDKFSEDFLNSMTYNFPDIEVISKGQSVYNGFNIYKLELVSYQGSLDVVQYAFINKQQQYTITLYVDPERPFGVYADYANIFSLMVNSLFDKKDSSAF